MKRISRILVAIDGSAGSYAAFSKDAVTVKTQALGSGVARDILTESQQGYDVLVVGCTGISKVEDISLGGIAAEVEPMPS